MNLYHVIPLSRSRYRLFLFRTKSSNHTPDCLASAPSHCHASPSLQTRDEGVFLAGVLSLGHPGTILNFQTKDRHWHGRANAQSRILLSRNATPHRPLPRVLLWSSLFPHQQHARYSVGAALHCNKYAVYLRVLHPKMKYLLFLQWCSWGRSTRSLRYANT